MSVYSITANDVDETAHVHTSDGDLQVVVTGDFDGGVLVLRYDLSDNSAYIELPQAQVTRESVRIYTLKAGNIKPQVKYAGSNLSLTVDIK